MGYSAAGPLTEACLNYRGRPSSVVEYPVVQAERFVVVVSITGYRVGQVTPYLSPLSTAVPCILHAVDLQMWLEIKH